MGNKMQAKSTNISARSAKMQADPATVRPEGLRLDTRRASARRFNEILAGLVAAIEGTARPEQIQIARQAASISQWLDVESAKQANGESLDIGGFVNASGAYTRLLALLGIDPSAENPDRPDHVPSLRIW